VAEAERKAMMALIAKEDIIMEGILVHGNEIRTVI
jgi:hypothetical protein